MQRTTEGLSNVTISHSATPARADRLAEITRLIGPDATLAAAAGRYASRVFREGHGLVADTHTEVAWLREALRGYEVDICPQCVQDPREGEPHLPDCPIGVALGYADMLGEIAAVEVR